jgi:hypothetical protein
VRAAVLLAVALAAVALAVWEWREHRRPHRRPVPLYRWLVEDLDAEPIAPTAPPTTPEGIRRVVIPADVVDRVHWFLVDASRRADAGEPLPAAVLELLTRRAAGGAR